VLPQHPGHLQQRRVPGRIVADPLVPRVEVPVDQDELLRLHRPADLRHQHGDGPPSLIQLRGVVDLHGATLRQRAQPRALGLVDGQHGNPGFAADGVQVGRTPDRGADALMNALSRADEHRCPRAPILERGDLARGGITFRQHDTALDIGGDIHPGKDRADPTGLSGRDIDQIPTLPAAVGRQRHRGRLGGQGAAFRGQDFQAGAARQADQQFGFVQRVGDAPLRQVLHDVLDPFALGLAPRIAHQGVEPLDQRPRDVQRNRRSHGLLARVLPRRRPVHNGSSPFRDELTRPTVDRSAGRP